LDLETAISDKVKILIFLSKKVALYRHMRDRDIQPFKTRKNNILADYFCFPDLYPFKSEAIPDIRIRNTGQLSKNDQIS
jgi:hypothetical protein